MRPLFFFFALLFGMYYYMSVPTGPTNGVIQSPKATFASNTDIYIPKKAVSTAPTTFLNRTEFNYLTSFGWKFQTIISDKPVDTDGDGVQTTDIISEMPLCALDDVMFVRKDGTVDFRRNEPCDSEAAVESYNWTLSKSGVFNMKNSVVSADMILKSVAADRLVMVIPQESGGEMFNFTVTYAAVRDMP